MCKVPRNFINSRAFEHIFLLDSLVVFSFFLLDFFLLELKEEDIELDDEDDEDDEDDDEDDEDDFTDVTLVRDENGEVDEESENDEEDR